MKCHWDHLGRVTSVITSPGLDRPMKQWGICAGVTPGGKGGTQKGRIVIDHGLFRDRINFDTEEVTFLYFLSLIPSPAWPCRKDNIRTTSGLQYNSSKDS